MYSTKKAHALSWGRFELSYKYEVMILAGVLILIIIWEGIKWKQLTILYPPSMVLYGVL